MFILTVFILSPRQFCAQPGHAHGVFCRHLSESRTEASRRVIEGSRRRMVVDVRLENKGENAYSARLNITYTPNLRFSSLNVKVGCWPCLKTNKWSPSWAQIQTIILMQDTSDIKIDCYTENKLRNEKICNVSAPFMRAKSQVRSSCFNFCRFSMFLMLSILVPEDTCYQSGPAGKQM